MEKYICMSYNTTMTMKDLSIGYTRNSSIFLVIIPSFTLFLNLLSIIAYFNEKIIEKKTKVSMDRMILILTISECFIAFYWMMSELKFHTTKNITENCMECFYLSLYGIFSYSFIWIFISFSLSNLKVIITDPIKGILKPNIRLVSYMLLSFFIALIITLFAYLIDVYGISPMLTCFLRTEYDDNMNRKLKVMIFNCLPFVSIVYSYYLLIFVLGKSRIRKNKHLLSSFMKYILNVSIFYILNTPMFVLIIMSSFFMKIERNTFSGWFSFVCCFLSVSSGLILSLIRISQGYSRYLSNFIYRIFRRCRTTKENKITLLGDNESSKDIENERKDEVIKNQIQKKHTNDFFELEKKILENFSRDLFIGICYSLTESKIRKRQSNIPKFDKKEIKKDSLNTNDFTLSKENLNFSDEEILKSEHIEFEIIEYAPKIFQILRDLDGLNEDSIIESLKPSRNKLSIKKTQGKGGSFFITSDDNKFIMKTITADELELIRGIFLIKFLKHLRRFPESLICRIYGIYRMIMIDGSDVVVLLMRNIIGPLQENVICKYDLKGSTINRQTELDIDNLGKIVMKDNNFVDIEHYLFMNKSEINRLRQNCISDGNFLNDMELMDYSLFLVKISLTQNQIKQIFEDEEINQFCEKNRKGIVSDSKKSNVYLNTEDCLNIDEPNKTQNTLINENITESDSKSKGDNSSVITLEKLEMTIEEIKSYRKYMYRSLYNNIIYLVSVIDYFQIYNFFKYLETNIKSFVTQKNKYGISCVPPHVYLSRFIGYINRITDMDKALNEGFIMNYNLN